MKLLSVLFYTLIKPVKREVLINHNKLSRRESSFMTLMDYPMDGTSRRTSMMTRRCSEVIVTTDRTRSNLTHANQSSLKAANYLSAEAFVSPKPMNKLPMISWLTIYHTTSTNKQNNFKQKVLQCLQTSLKISVARRLDLFGLI